MMYSKIDIFSKVGDLLVEINDSYAALSEDGLLNKTTELILLEGKTRYLAAHLSALQSLLANDVFPVEQAEGHVTKTEEAEVKANKAVSEAPVIEQVEQAFVHEPLAEPASKEINFAELSKSSVSELNEAAAVVEQAAAPELEPAIAAAAFLPPVFEQEIPEVKPEPAQQEVVTAAAMETFVHQVVEAPKNIVIEEPTSGLEEKAVPTRPLTLNEILQQQKKANTVTSNFAQPNASTERIADLKHAISLNDKLLFIKDLFNGYSLAYSEAVELLNRYATYAEADAFLQTNYALKNNWQDKNQTVEKLYVILRKKYM